MLTYGFEAMVPVELGAGSFRREHFDEETNEINHRFHLDILKEGMNTSQIGLVIYQQRTARHYNEKVRARPF